MINENLLYNSERLKEYILKKKTTRTKFAKRVLLTLHVIHLIWSGKPVKVSVIRYLNQRIPELKLREEGNL